MNFHDFIYFDKDFTGEHGDFSGKTSALDCAGRINFLKAYSEYCEKNYKKNNKSEYAVKEEEIEKTYKKINYDITPKLRKQIKFNDCDIFTKPLPREYDNWDFYTNKIIINNGEVIFSDGEMPAVPGAKYSFRNDKQLKSINLTLVIDESFDTKFKEPEHTFPPHITKTGRIIEINGEKTEILKIQFYSTKEIYARVGIPDKYHHNAVFIGNFEFNEQINLKIDFYEDTFSVNLNGKLTEKIKYTEKDKAKYLYFCGGRHPIGNWKVKLNQIDYNNEIVTDFFKKSYKPEEKPEYLGKKDLPFAIAGYENRDKILIISKNIDYDGNKNVILNLHGLNPGGEIFVNAQKIQHFDDFLSHKLNITDFLNHGTNNIQIHIFPRAPEKLYSWHRSNDTYNGWYCDKVEANYVPKSYIQSVKITTLSVKPEITAEIEVNFNQQYKGICNFYLQPSNPELKNEEKIQEFQANGKKLKVKTKINADLWTPENPTLYILRTEIENDDFVIETGFRTVDQINGEFHLNGKKTFLCGALIMQFLPPYENICKSHTCPDTKEIIWEILALKNMNSNLARLHLLGYGTNEERFAEICDRLGIMLIWTTNLIDSVESIMWTGKWRQANAYISQMRDVINHPSIIIWEGSNEWRAERKGLDTLFDEFTDTVKKEDKSRLICPCSHCYYGGNLYGEKGFYYQDDGKKDQNFNICESSHGWTDDLVIRSSHTYEIMLGYGRKWDEFRSESWDSEPALFKSKKHMYIVSEVAVIGRHDDTTPECQKYVKSDSYELGDENSALGVNLTQKDFKISQAYQALCANHIIKSLKRRDADGITWCCLSSGANDGSYFKPPIDFYGYAKYAYYIMKEAFQKTICFDGSTDVVFGSNTEISPILCGTEKGNLYNVVLNVTDSENKIVFYKTYNDVQGSEMPLKLEPCNPQLKFSGYYTIKYDVEKL